MNAPTALYSALCLNKNLSTNKIISLMIQILNRYVDNISRGMTSIEILKFIDNLAEIGYNNMSLEEVKTYFQNIIKHDNNNNDNDDNDDNDDNVTNSKDHFSFITDNDNNTQYIGSFEIIKAIELTDKLTISCTKNSDKYTIFIYINDNNNSIISYQMNLLVN
jgi:hypothetical protein